MRHPIRTPFAAAVAAGIALAGLTGCSAADLQQAKDVGSSVASDVSDVSDGVRGIDGSAIEQGMAKVAGGIDGALDTALEGAKVTSDGELPSGFPSRDVPLVDGTVLGGGAAPDDVGWVAQVRAPSVASFDTAAAQLESAGYTASAVRTDDTSAFGIFRSDAYRVVLTFSSSSGGVTATYIVTSR